jgi:hypothetical protein
VEQRTTQSPGENEFGSKVIRVAAELKGSIDDDRERTFVKRLFQEYLAAGEPPHILKWLRPRLEKLYNCIGDRPRWIQRSEEWPFSNGLPMTFIQQFDVPEFEFPDGKVAVAKTIYVFCTDVPLNNSGPWEIQYRIIEQYADLAVRHSPHIFLQARKKT